jgi:hypothetical protein
MVRDRKTLPTLSRLSFGLRLILEQRPVFRSILRSRQLAESLDDNGSVFIRLPVFANPIHLDVNRLPVNKHLLKTHPAQSCASHYLPRLCWWRHSHRRTGRLIAARISQQEMGLNEKPNSYFVFCSLIVCL